MTAPSHHTPILIVEDDKKTASLIALYLEKAGFRTLLAYDGATALELAADHKPMFVVLDLMLPRGGWMGGLPAAEKDVGRADSDPDRQGRRGRPCLGAHPRRRRLRGQAV